MRVTFVILSLAVFYLHIARGLPAEPVKKQPQADPAPTPAPQPEKPDECKANIEGRDQTVKPGDRYCLDETTARVCNWGGEWIDQKCDPGAKCLKSKTEFKVLCRIDNRKPRPAAPQDSDVQNSDVAPTKVDSVPPPAAPRSVPAPPAPASEPRPDDRVPPPTPAPKPDAEPVPPPAPKPTPSVNPVPPPAPVSEPRPDDRVPPPKPTPSVDPIPPPPPSPQPEKPETCKATIDGKEVTLQPGDRYCLSDSTNRVCNYGEFVDYECPSQSKCMKSPDKWQVLCRIVSKNPKTGGDDKSGQN